MCEGRPLRTLFLTAAVAAAALLAPTAAQAAPFVIGDGFKPSVAMDAIRSVVVKNG